MQFQGGYNKFTFDVSDFSKGIYFVEVIRNGERTVKKLVVEH
ncbi:MAG: T9SS type A sorting domain-containing protein [Flavobacteriales bacterium]